MESPSPWFPLLRSLCALSYRRCPREGGVRVEEQPQKGAGPLIQTVGGGPPAPPPPGRASPAQRATCARPVRAPQPPAGVCATCSREGRERKRKG